MRRARVPWLVALAGAVACSNAGENRFLSVTAMGVVKGAAYIDNNGNGQFDGQDTTFAGLRIRLVLAGVGDSVAAVVVPTGGQFRIDSVPVGRYTIRVDTALLGDSLKLLRVDSATVTVKPADSVLVFVLVGFPHVTVAQARALPPGRKVFVDAIALTTRGTFRDTTISVQDTSRAIRVERLRTSVFISDSVRLFATTFRRDGQPVLRDATSFTLGAAFLPTADTVTTAVAATANGGVLDAAQALVLNATISDTASVGADFRLTVTDSSGPLEVLLDPTADQAFGQSQSPFFPYLPGKKFQIVGILVPTGTANVWRLKPRSTADLVLRP